MTIMSAMTINILSVNNVCYNIPARRICVRAVEAAILATDFLRASLLVFGSGVFEIYETFCRLLDALLRFRFVKGVDVAVFEIFCLSCTLDTKDL
eukprot:m.278699 g.278699  ORF g.278699 m.278699 type:complete len:95 (-) comp16318_c0_seq1:1867-2151(-)